MASKKAKAKKSRKAKGGHVVITDSTLAMARMDSIQAAKWPRMPLVKIPPNVAPKETRLAHDKAVKLANDYIGEYGVPGAFGGMAADLFFLGYPALALLTQKAEFRRPSEIIAKTMTREGFRLKSTGTQDKTKKIAKLNAALKKHHIIDKLRELAEQDGQFGRSNLYIDTGHGDDADELKTPLILSKAKIAKGATIRFKVVEPLWSYPNDYNSTDPLKPDFFRPNTWWVQQKEVHRTRFLTFVSREVPDILKPAYMFGGLSLSQMAMVYVENWLRAQQNVSDLIANFSASGIKTDLGNLTQAGGEAEFQKRMEFFNLARNNRGLLLIDKANEDYFNVAVPLGSLDKLQAQAQEHQAAVTGIPLVVYFGITPSGLNASSDGEIRAFYDWIHAVQEQLFTTHLTTIIHILQLVLFGAIDDEIYPEWVPLWQLDEAGQASVEKTKADTAAVLIDKGVIDPEDERTRQAGDENSMYHGINPDDVPEPPEQQNLNEGEPGGDPAKSAEPAQARRSGV